MQQVTSISISKDYRVLDSLVLVLGY